MKIELNIGEKVSITETYSEHFVMVVRKGQIGIFQGYTTKGMHVSGIYQDVEMAEIQLKNGKTVLIPPKLISPYEKKVHVRIEDLPSDELVSRFEYLSAHEVQGKMGTKVHAKIIKDLDRCRAELLKRLNQ